MFDVVIKMYTVKYILSESSPFDMNAWKKFVFDTEPGRWGSSSEAEVEVSLKV
jgi:hypothetical protein